MFYMNKKIMIVLIAILAIICGSVVYAAESSQLNVTTPDVLKNGDKFNITLTSSDGSPIANEDIHITVIASGGEQNNISFKTDKDGVASFGISGVSTGKYVFNCTFQGNDKYDTANLEKNITIE